MSGSPRVYRVEVWRAGRVEAQAAAQHINDAARGLTILDKIRYQERHGSGIERYTFRVWWLAALEDDEDDEG